MKIFRASQFLTKGFAQLDTQGCVAVGIHPSSEVCLVDVAGMMLAVGGIVPLPPKVASIELLAVHWPLNGDQLFGADANNFTPADGVTEGLGDKLVLQLYEKCDALVPPGPRVPLYKDVQVAAANIGLTAENAKLAMRVPFHGRAACAIAFTRPGAADDLSLLVVGRSYGRRNPISPLSAAWVAGSNDFGDAGGVWHEMAIETRLNGGGAAAATPSIEAAQVGYRWRQVVVGGEADASEAFDELQLFVFGPAGALARLTAEAYGERTH